jgi:hypothetical protein
LKIGELGDLHPIEPDLPTETPCTQGRGFPIVLHKSDVVGERIDPKAVQTIQVDVLDREGGGLHDNLILIVVLQAVGVLTIAAVSWTARWLYICAIPGFGPEDPQEGGGVEGPGPHFSVIRLLDDAPLLIPKTLQG